MASCAIAVVAIAAITLAAIELGLRLVPGLIPVALVADFPVDRRAVLAEALDLPRMAVRTPVLRTDGGPPLSVWNPNATFRVEADAADVALGAVAEFRMDDEGFCDDLDADERPVGSIVTLGDSFTWCTAVPTGDAWPQLLERRVGRPVRNLGLAGVGPYEYLQLYERFGAALRPRTVILNLYQGNDLRDAVAFQNGRTPGTIATPVERERFGIDSRSAVRVLRSGTLRVRDGWLGRLYSVDVLAAIVLQATATARHATFGYTVEADGATVAMNVHNVDTDEVEYARLALADDGLFAQAFSPALSAFAEMSRRDGFVPVVALTPSAYTAYASSVRFADAGVGETVVAFAERQRAWVASQCAALGLRFVDLAPPLQAAASRSTLLYFPANVHLTPAGHDVVSRALAE